MVRTIKNNSIHVGKKNVDITNVINSIKQNTIVDTNIGLNTNQLGGKKNNTKKNSKNTNDNDSKFDSSDDDYDEQDDDDDEQNDDEQDIEDVQNADEPNEQQNEDNEDDENINDNYSEKSDKESEIGDDEKNYIDDEETLKTKCYSKYAKVDYEELDFDELFGDETILVGKNIRVSKPVLTKYEFVRLLTDRTKQLAQGAKHMLKNTQELSSKEIAKLEIKEGVIPLIIERPIPNSKSERWKVSELYIPDHLFSM